jgi:hypothetical protein
METILIPGDSWLLTAEFIRKGHDLILVGPNGKEFLNKRLLFFYYKYT